MAVFAAEKARRQRRAANAASVGGRSAAAAAMTAAAAQLPQHRGGEARQAGNGAHLRRQPEVAKERLFLKRRANRAWVGLKGGLCCIWVGDRFLGSY